MCRQVELRIPTLADWIYIIFTRHNMTTMLGVSTLEWRNRCIADNSFPLPREDSSNRRGGHTPLRPHRCGLQPEVRIGHSTLRW